MDRRIRKTKEAIIEAFVRLMAEKNFEQITINEIADLANVIRGTVYLHYVDKYDLLDQCIEAHLNQLFTSCMSDGDTADFSSKASMLRTFEYLEKHAFFYSTMLTNKGAPAFRSRLLSTAVHNLDELIDMNEDKNGMKKEILIQFIASAAIGVLEWWITNAMPYPASEMVDQFWSLLESYQLMLQK